VKTAGHRVSESQVLNKEFSQIKKGGNQDVFWYNNTKIQRH
jgi:hypothetical protein